MGVMRQVIEQTITTIQAIPGLGLVLSPTPVEARNIPNTITEKVFSVTMQSENTDKFRDRSPAGNMRLGHDVTVSILCRLPPMDQMEGYNDAIDIEESIIVAMLVQSSLPTFRTLYESSNRTLIGRETNATEYVLIDITFSIEQSIGLT